MVLCILWNRLGTPLTGPDGRQYPSGTDYEVESAHAAFALTGKPELMFYLDQTRRGSARSRARNANA